MNDDPACFSSGGLGVLIYSGSSTSFIDYGVIIGNKFSNATAIYHVVALDAASHQSAPSNGKSYLENLITKMVAKPVEDEEVAPSQTRLESNYPNPFNPTTRFSFQLAEPGRVSLKIYNILGQVVAALVEDSYGTGYYSTTWDAGSAPSGLYYARILISDGVGRKVYEDTRKLLLVK